MFFSRLRFLIFFLCSIGYSLFGQTEMNFDSLQPKLIPALGHVLPIQNTAISPDGKFVAMQSEHSTISIWDLSTGKLIHWLKETDYEMHSLEFSPNGKYVLGGIWREAAIIWEVSTGKVVQKLPGYTSCAIFSKDSKQVITGSVDGTIGVWDLQTGRLIRKLEGHTGEITSVTVSQGGRYIISGSADSTVCIWDVSSGGFIHSLQGHKDSIKTVISSNNGKYVINIKLLQQNNYKVIKLANYLFIFFKGNGLLQVLII